MTDKDKSQLLTLRLWLRLKFENYSMTIQLRWKHYNVAKWYFAHHELTGWTRLLFKTLWEIHIWFICAMPLLKTLWQFLFFVTISPFVTMSPPLFNYIPLFKEIFLISPRCEPFPTYILTLFDDFWKHWEEMKKMLNTST